MKVNVRLFAAARETVGSEQITLELASDATVAQLREALHQQYEPLRTLLPHALIAVNSEYAPLDHPLGANDEIACIPPVSGG